MNKLCKRKFAKTSVSVMVWTKYQTCLQRNAKIFERKTYQLVLWLKMSSFILLLDLRMIEKITVLYSLVILFWLV